MNWLLKNALAVAAVAIATHATAQVTFYQDDGFRGQSFTAERDVANFQRFGFNDRASSVVVQGERWEVCEDARFEGRCVVLRPGRYPSLSAIGLSDRIRRRVRSEGMSVPGTTALCPGRLFRTTRGPAPRSPSMSTTASRAGPHGRPRHRGLHRRRLQRPRFVDRRSRRQLGGLRRCPVRGPLRDPAARPLSVVVLVGPERPDLVGAPGGRQRPCCRQPLCARADCSGQRAAWRPDHLL